VLSPIWSGSLSEPVTEPGSRRCSSCAVAWANQRNPGALFATPAALVSTAMNGWINLPDVDALEAETSRFA